MVGILSAYEACIYVYLSTKDWSTLKITTTSLLGVATDKKRMTNQYPYAFIYIDYAVNHTQYYAFSPIASTLVSSFHLIKQNTTTTRAY